MERRSQFLDTELSTDLFKVDNFVTLQEQRLQRQVELRENESYRAIEKYYSTQGRKLPEKRSIVLLPTGVMGIHVKYCWDLNLQGLFQDVNDVDFFMEISMGTVVKNTAEARLKGKKYLVFDEVKHFSKDIDNDLAHPSHVLNMVLYGKTSDDLMEVGRTKMHQFELLRLQNISTTLELTRKNGVVIGKLDTEFVFRYGSFGYGYSNQMKVRHFLHNNKEETVCTSLMPRINPTDKSQEDAFFILNVLKENYVLDVLQAIDEATVKKKVCEFEEIWDQCSNRSSRLTWLQNTISGKNVRARENEQLLQRPELKDLNLLSQMKDLPVYPVPFMQMVQEAVENEKPIPIFIPLTHDGYQKPSSTEVTSTTGYRCAAVIEDSPTARKFSSGVPYVAQPVNTSSVENLPIHPVPFLQMVKEAVDKGKTAPAYKPLSPEPKMKISDTKLTAATTYKCATVSEEISPKTSNSLSAIPSMTQIISTSAQNQYQSSLEGLGDKSQPTQHPSVGVVPVKSSSMTVSTVGSRSSDLPITDYDIDTRVTGTSLPESFITAKSQEGVTENKDHMLVSVPELGATFTAISSVDITAMPHMSAEHLSSRASDQNSAFTSPSQLSNTFTDDDETNTAEDDSADIGLEVLTIHPSLHDIYENDP